MNKLSIKYGLFFLLLSLMSSYSFAVDNHMQHQQADLKSVEQSPATTDFLMAMTKMHQPMMDGIMDKNADIAFVKGMIPHHQGAIDMSEIILKYSNDPQIRQLAEDIIAAQKKEIKLMHDWLAKHDKQ